MPEGPEVKTVAKTLKEGLMGARLGTLWHSAYRLRKTVDYQAMKALQNTVITNIECYGKIIFLDVNHKPGLLAQLGMTGQLFVTPSSTEAAIHTHIRWSLNDGNQELRYVDPRRFGLFDLCNHEQKEVILKRLGKDPFTISLNDYSSIYQAIKKSHRSIKEVLLDQAMIVGVGNIYASEALFAAGIHPQRAASSIKTKEFDVLLTEIIAVLKSAYKNAGTTFANYVDGTGKKGNNAAFLKVFQKDASPCPRCQTSIMRLKQGGRSTFFCPRCQK